MHYKYVWRGLEEMFEFAHLHLKRPSSYAGGLFQWRYALVQGQVLSLSMPRGSAPIIPCGSAFRICPPGKYTAPAVALMRELWLTAMLGAFFSGDTHCCAVLSPS